MSDINIPWRPRVIMPGRTFRLPVTSDRDDITLDAAGFTVVDSRWDAGDGARYYYLCSPSAPGDYTITARQGEKEATSVIQVRSLTDLRRSHVYNGAVWPRRWPLDTDWESKKTAQTLQDIPVRIKPDDKQIAWWMSLTDEAVWRELPFPEFPQAHFVNVNQGCPNCGTAVFKNSGFYPWTRTHYPGHARSTCPTCRHVFPSNDFQNGDFTSGQMPDDGYGYFDEDGHIYLFTATWHRDRVMGYDSQLQQMTGRLRSGPFDPSVARTLTIMLLRYAVDILYLAAVPQFRYGPSRGEEEPWIWGQPDWADEPDPVGALLAKGMRRYAIDVPYVSESLALAYDTLWPFIPEDREIVDRAQALGVPVETPADVVHLIEEMLAAQLQCIMDWGARSNLPRESMGALNLLRGLDRPDAQDVMDWLFDEGPDRMRVFGINNFFPDGSPFEATGGYNGIHTNGLFALEYHLRALRSRHPQAYPESAYPSLVDDPRAARVARQPHEVTMIGKSWFQFGDGSSPGSKAQQGQTVTLTESLVLKDILLHSRIAPETLARAAEYTSDPIVQDILEADQTAAPRHIGTTIHDGVGIAILRTDESPERAALGVVYGDVSNHRHMDLLDVQLFAHSRPFLTDLGYPQSWATIHRWEGNWATHNTVWGVIPGVQPEMIAGRGRLVRTLVAEGVQVLDIEAERWTQDADRKQWVKQPVSYRRLLALVETDGDGIAVIDFTRVRGGVEHWRVCQGLQGDFGSDALMLSPQPGTVASEDGVRGDDASLRYPDYAGLACMDDVMAGIPDPAWRGAWTSAIEPEVSLDLYQVGVSDGTTLLTARSTALMGTPEQSDYNFRTLLWRRTPQSTDETTHVDLVFEPRVGESCLDEVRPIRVAEGNTEGRGVTLITSAGKEITLYWAPEAEGRETIYEDGTALSGPLAVVVDGRITTTGVKQMTYREKQFTGPGTKEGRIVDLDRKACTIDVEGLSGIKRGDRIRVNPEGRAHSYEVVQVDDPGDDRVRLTLDVTSLIGRSPVKRIDDHKIDLAMHVLTRTGNLQHVRLEAENGDWTVITQAYNEMPGRGATFISVEDASRLGPPKPGDWVQVVDYVVGDTVMFEPGVTG